MPKINVLPKEVYSLIAAGEVVERPMSIVKEMIENSIDAGAKHITVEIKNGGTTYIRITDDGCGIAGEDVKKVFISHATSKISTGSDLDSIATLGFRGEAMASIAAVAKVELLTKAENEETGVRYEIAGGEELDFSDAGCPQGTTVVVRDIFFNVPARMKFLKKDVTEGNSVQGIVERIAISNPDISFRFIREGRQAMITAGNGDLKSTIYSVYGSELSETLVPVEYHYSGMRLTGYVSRPHQSRKSRAMQFFFINGRLVDSRLAKAALEQAYKNLIMVGRFPACVLNIEMDTKLVDVNVHPAKIEVRFVNEKPIFDLIYYGVKTAVEQQDTVKEGKLSDNSISSVYGNQIKTNSSKIDFFKKEEKPNQLKFSSASPKTWSLASPKAQLRRETSEEENIKKDIKEESVFDKPIEAKEKAEIKTEQIEIPVQNNAFSENTQPVTEEIDSSVIVDEKDDAPVFRVVGEAFRTYIIVEIENDLYYIDKHAAHERMNFEKLKAESNISSQLLLMPVAVKLSAEEYSVITDNIPLLSKCGFEVEDFGNLSVIVRETPSMLDGSDIKDLILEIAEKLLRHKTDIEPDKMDWIFHSTACRSAVKGGDYTSEKERELFVEKLLSMPDIRYCPHGRPVMIKISRYELEKQFGRIQ
ncbi:DNA mismatch repair protein MutL [Clostridiales bacterium]|nr:DNA mismatch repair protein MutL [Clostridiales bacterium]